MGGGGVGGDEVFSVPTNSPSDLYTTSKCLRCIWFAEKVMFKCEVFTYILKFFSKLVTFVRMCLSIVKRFVVSAYFPKISKSWKEI